MHLKFRYVNSITRLNIFLNEHHLYCVCAGYIKLITDLFKFSKSTTWLWIFCIFCKNTSKRWLTWERDTRSFLKETPLTNIPGYCSSLIVHVFSAAEYAAELHCFQLEHFCIQCSIESLDMIVSLKRAGTSRWDACMMLIMTLTYKNNQVEQCLIIMNISDSLCSFLYLM